MGQFVPKEGQEVFLEDGRRAIFAGHIDGQAFVRAIMSCDDEYGREEWPSDKLTPIGRVFQSEPEFVLGDVTKAKRAELQELHAAIEGARSNLTDLQAQERAFAAAAAQFPQLQTAIDFLEGNITHVVEIPRYGAPKISKLSDMLEQKSDCGRNEGLRLLCLFGVDECKKTRWAINRYSDGSGINTIIEPFKNLEDAEDYIRAEHQAAINLWRAGVDNHCVHRFLGCPVDLDWPDDLMSELTAYNRRQIDDRIASLEGQIADLRSKRP